MSHSALGNVASPKAPPSRTKPPKPNGHAVPTSRQELRAMLAAKLKESDLTLRDAQWLGYKSLLVSEFPPSLNHPPAAGFLLPYSDVRGTPTDFFRFRYLEQPVLKFGAVSQKPFRYIQPAIPPRAYFPCIFDWPEWLKGEEPLRLLITEGELKAGCGVKHGFPTIGLGGMWNFRSETESLIADLSELPWPRILAYIVFDIDPDAEKNDVADMAANTLARELLAREAQVKIVHLPLLNAKHKTGLDDFLHAQGTNAASALEAILTDPERSTEPSPYDVRDAYYERPMAERWVAAYKDSLRYVRTCDTDPGRWMVFNGQWCGNRAAAQHLLGEFLKAEMPAPLVGESMEKAAKKAVQQIRKQLSTALYAANVLKLAATQPGIHLYLQDFDTNPALLGLPEGKVCDLRTGAIRPSVASDYVSRSTSVMPGGDCPHWKAFLKDITSNDQELIDFLQLYAGYCTTGYDNEELWIVLYGSGGNGKGTYAETQYETLGDASTGGYAAMIPAQSLVAQRNPNDYSTQNDIALLVGARLGVHDEGEKHRRMNSDLVKKHTGGGRMTAKLMGKDKFNFKVTHKLLSLCNYLPDIEVDDAMRRRLKLVELKNRWKSNPSKEDLANGYRAADPQLKSKLRSELRGVLAWNIEGAVRWHKIGLKLPASAEKFTANFFNTADPIENWIAARGYVKDINSFIPSGQLWTNWEAYCKGLNQFAGTFTTFCEDLGKRKETFVAARRMENKVQQRGFYGLRFGAEKKKPKYATKSEG